MTTLPYWNSKILEVTPTSPQAPTKKVNTSVWVHFSVIHTIVQVVVFNPSTTQFLKKYLTKPNLNVA